MCRRRNSARWALTWSSQLGKGLARGCCGALAHGRDRVAAGVLVVDVAGLAGHQQGQATRAAQAQLAAAGLDLPVAHRLHAQRIAQLACDTEGLHIAALDQQGVAAVGADRQRSGALLGQQRFAMVPGRTDVDHAVGVVLGVAEATVGLVVGMAVAEVEVDHALADDLQTDHRHLVGRTAEGLPLVACAAVEEAGQRDGAGEVEAAPVALHALQAGEVEQQVTGAAEGHLLDGLAHQRFGNQVVGLLPALLGYQAAHLGQGLAEPRVVCDVGPAAVEGVDVELQPLLGRAAENHGAQAAVADGQGLDPGAGGLVVPEGQRVIGDVRGAAAREGGQGGQAAGQGAAGEEVAAGAHRAAPINFCSVGAMARCQIS